MPWCCTIVVESAMASLGGEVRLHSLVLRRSASDELPDVSECGPSFTESVAVKCPHSR